MNSIELMREFLEEHESQYKGKYRFFSGYRHEEHGYKAQYYIYDQSFRKVTIFIEVYFEDKITYVFSEDLNDQEKLYIVKDLLKRMLDKENYKTVLHYSLYEQYVENLNYCAVVLEPRDFGSILYYMKYHRGMNSKTVDEFYNVVIPCLHHYLESKNYKKYLNVVNYLLDIVLYENDWMGTTSKYLDTEYEYHLKYLKDIIFINFKNLDDLYENSKEELVEHVRLLCTNQRFSFCILTEFKNSYFVNWDIIGGIVEGLKDEFPLYDMNDRNKKGKSVYSYIYYKYKKDEKQVEYVVMNILRKVMNNVITYVNHELDLTIGNNFVSRCGYDIILELFKFDYNTFIFTCFPISSFPTYMKPQVKERLVQAIQFYCARMENEKYKLSSFEQVMNINRLLMDNFKEWYK